MDLSIIIVNWNTKDLLLECIKSSIADLKDFKFEIIVVDNNSSDNSVEEVESRFKEVIVIKNSVNLGFSKANNIAIRRAKGKYLCLLNSDIEIIKGCFSNVLLCMQENENVGLLGPRIINPDHSFQPTCRRKPSVWNNLVEAVGVHNYFSRSKLLSGEFIYLENTKKLYDVDIVNGCFWVIRKDALEKVGLLDENFYFYGEDKDFSIRFKRAGWRVVYFPLASAIHYGGASSSKKPVKYMIELQKAHCQFLKKHYSVFEQSILEGIRVIYLFNRIIVNCVKLIRCKNNSVRTAYFKDSIRINYIAMKWFFMRFSSDKY